MKSRTRSCNWSASEEEVMALSREAVRNTTDT